MPVLHFLFSSLIGVQGLLILLCLVLSQIAHRRLPEPQRSFPHLLRTVGLVCAILATLVLIHARLTIPVALDETLLVNSETRPFAVSALALAIVGGTIVVAEAFPRLATIKDCDQVASRLERLGYVCCFGVAAIPIWMVCDRLI